MALVATLADEGSSDGSPRSSVSVVSDVQPAPGGSGTKTSPLSFEFRLTDSGFTPVDVAVFYSQAGGSEVPLVLSGNTNLNQLASSPTGVVHSRAWDFAAQFGGTSLVLDVRLVVRLQSGSGSSSSVSFDLGNDPPVVTVLSTPGGEQSEVVVIPLDVSDSSGDSVSVLVEYDDLDDPLGWRPATSLGTPSANITASPGGVPLEFLWDVAADEPSREFRARLRFSPTDGFDPGTPVETADLLIDNNEAPLALINGSAFFANPDDKRGIPVPFEVIDPEGDPVRVVFQWRRPNGSFPALPGDPSALDAILASADARLQYQIATESTTAHRGRVSAFSSTTARLPEIGRSAAGLLAEFIVGRRLEIFRRSRTPQLVAASWTSNPLSSPEWVLPLGDGIGALVLDSPSTGSWRIQEIDLATGAVLDSVATGVDGDPNALAMESADRVLLAIDNAGIWTIHRVSLTDGTVTPLITTAGGIATGKVRGLVSLSQSRLLLTVGSALIAVDDFPPAAAVENALVTDFQSAWGLARDPRRANRVYVAERDWVNPSNSQVEGRVVVLDLDSLSRAPVVASGPALARPTAVALEPGGTGLVALTDEDPADGTVELRAVRLGGGSGGVSHEVASGLPSDAAGLATGPDGLRAFCVRSQSELAVASGLQQARTITSFDLNTLDATVDAPFDPLPTPGVNWRIIDRSDSLPAGSSVRADTFTWASGDLASAGEVILRAVAYDTEPGVSTDSGVPRTVRSSISVVASELGGGAFTAGVSSVAAADLNGDGTLDLVSSNAGSDSLTVFFQSGQGAFSATPDVTIQGIPLVSWMLEPRSVTPVDVDLNGLLDLVSANRGSDDLSVAVQVLPGVFVVEPLSLGPGIVDPVSVTAADLNGDGRDDLVSANSGSDNLAVFFQLPVGLYAPLPSRLLGDATTLAPSDVAVGDLDGDADLDIVCANSSSDNLAVFLKPNPGILPSTPSFLLGGSGLTDGPAAVIATDLDGDGRTDLASANRDGNSLTVFLQTDTGSFDPTPTFTLTSSSGPVQPEDLAAADINLDGGIDLVSANGNLELTVFFYSCETGTYESEPLTGLQASASVAAEDLDGDGFVDLQSASATGDGVSIFFQTGDQSLRALDAPLVVGGALHTPGVRGVALGDLDGDADLDLVCASEANDTAAIFHQLGPGVIGLEPAYVLGSGSSTAGLRAVALADLNSDGRLDIATANSAAGSVAIFFQLTDGSFSPAPDALLGVGALGTPTWIDAGDLDGDGDLDVVCADATGDSLAVFLRSASGSFAGPPDVVVGDASSTDGPSMVVAVDLDDDGRIDLLSANADADTLSVFFQTAGGTFNPLPDLTLGGPGATDSPAAVAAADLDDDGAVDIVCANEASHELAVFLATGPGVFPLAPSIRLSDPSLLGPTALAVSDADGDGLREIVAGYSGSDNLAVFFQESPAAFHPVPATFGGAGFTDSPQSLVVLDIDRDGDLDVVSAQPDLDNVPVLFGRR